MTISHRAPINDLDGRRLLPISVYTRSQQAWRGAGGRRPGSIAKTSLCGGGAGGSECRL